MALKNYMYSAAIILILLILWNATSNTREYLSRKSDGVRAVGVQRVARGINKIKKNKESGRGDERQLQINDGNIQRDRELYGIDYTTYKNIFESVHKQ